MTDAHALAGRIGRMIKLERERQNLSQIALCRRAGIDQPALSRLERGNHAATTAAIERVLTALGYRLTVDVEPLDHELDAAIEAQSGLSAEDRATVAGRFRYPLKRLPAELDYRLAGALGAFLQGVPVDATTLDVAITPDGADDFTAWLRRIPNVIRWSDKHRDFTGYSKDPRDPGPVLPLPLIASLDPQIARIVDRVVSRTS